MASYGRTFVFSRPGLFISHAPHVLWEWEQRHVWYTTTKLLGLILKLLFRVLRTHTNRYIIGGSANVPTSLGRTQLAIKNLPQKTPEYFICVCLINCNWPFYPHPAELFLSSYLLPWDDKLNSWLPIVQLIKLFCCYFASINMGV